MPLKDASLMRDRIINFLKIKGPSLPVHIAKAVGMDMLFTSAFLSELISSGEIKTSHMKVGTSPLYLIPGQEDGLEKYLEYVKGKEGEAVNKLRKEKFLLDSEQEPAIKIALRTMKDFAKAFDKDGKIVWRYFKEKKEDYKSNKEEKETPKEPLKSEEKVREKSVKEEREKPKEKVEINLKTKSKERIKSQPKKSKTKKTEKKNDEKFFNRIKEHLLSKDYEILDIINFNKKDLILKIKKKNEELLVFAYNKKKVSEKDILSAYKKAKSLNSIYQIISIGEVPKKTSSLIEALKDLDSIEALNQKD